MDPYIHTVIATGLMYVSYRVGYYYGDINGIEGMVQTLLTIFKADGMEINEEGEFWIKKDGETKKVN